MRKINFLVAFFALLLLLTNYAFAQKVVDVEKTSEGDLKIVPVFHGSLWFEFKGKVIHVDPWSKGDYTGAPGADVILITDIHRDHLDPGLIDKLKKDTTKIVAPPAAEKQLPGAILLKNGETRTVEGVSIEAFPMYNLKREASPGVKYHEKGRGNGYIIKFGDKRVYVAGDTECTPEMKALKGIDIAFLPINLPYTMPPEEAAECAIAFKPKVVYPYHQGDSDPKAFEKLVKGTPGVEVRVRALP